MITNLQRRRAWDRTMRLLTVVALLLALIPLASILFNIMKNGLAALDLHMLTQLPLPPGDAGGGVANGIVGTLTVIAIAASIGVPVGVGAGVFMSEYSHNALARATRFMAEVMTGLPSIVAGIVGYELVVVTMGHFSALAGGIALSFLFVPVVAIASQDALQLVPRSHREAALALGLGEATTSLRVVLPTAMGGVLTGIMLAVARVAGETAPLLFTAFNNNFWPKGIDEPTATLPLQIFTFAVSPFKQWHEQAWAAAAILVMVVLILNIGVRALWARRARFIRGGLRG